MPQRKVELLAITGNYLHVSVALRVDVSSSGRSHIRLLLEKAKNGWRRNTFATALVLFGLLYVSRVNSVA